MPNVLNSANATYTRVYTVGELFGNYKSRTFYRPNAIPVTQPTVSEH